MLIYVNLDKIKEGSHSGLVRHVGNVVRGKLLREFESPILRKNQITFDLDFMGG